MIKRLIIQPTVVKDFHLSVQVIWFGLSFYFLGNTFDSFLFVIFWSMNMWLGVIDL